MTSAPNTDTLANTVAERMRLDIIAAGLTEGELFTTESEVTRRYGVSRNIAREAVSQLRSLGILVSRQGKGLLVGRSDPVGLLARSLPFYGRAPEDMKHLAQWRYVLEIGAVELAVNAATAEQTERLEALAREYRDLGTRDHTEEEENAVELAFHGLILRMTGNPLIAGMHDLLVTYFGSPRHQHDARTQDRPLTAWQHQAIAEAIRQRDIEQARVILRQHLQSMYPMEETLAAS